MKLFLLLLISIFSLSLAEIPVYECDSLTATLCFFKNVKLTPNRFHFQLRAAGGNNPESIAFVEFESSVIPVVYDNICTAFPKTTNLQLGESKIREITEDAFHACQNLKTLRLHKNKIKTLHPNTFQGLANLEFLNLAYNKITKIPDLNFFAGMPKLNSLLLQWNNLTEFPAELLQHNPEIFRLSINSNDLFELNVKKLLEYLPKLTYFHWFDNQVSCSKALEGIGHLEARGLTEVGCEAEIPIFKGDSSTPRSCFYEEVKLTRKNYEWLPSCGKISKPIDYVEFEDSVIPVVYDNICTAFPHTTSLQLGKSGVREIFENAFVPCPNLKTLRLHANKIKELHPDTFKGLQKLEFLNLAENHLTQIPDVNFFAGMPKLQYLFLEWNDLKEFPAELLKQNPEIYQLGLYSNDLLELNVKKLVEYLPKLKFFNWFDNDIACSHALEDMKFLATKEIFEWDCSSDLCDNSKSTNYETEKILGNFTCIPDATWQELKDRDLPAYRCDDSITVWCTFQNIRLNSTNYRWKPKANKTEIEYVEFESSLIPVVYSNICRAFPKMKNLQLGESGVQEVTEDAFYACANLETLRLHSNKIKVLHPTTFQGVPKMAFLNLGSNLLTEFPDLSFFAGMPKLQKLFLEWNNLKSFPAELLKYNPKMYQLALYSNNLSELDVEKLVKYLPNLKYFNWIDNEIFCSQALEGMTYLSSLGIVQWDCEEMCENPKKRDYVTDKVLGNFTCVPDKINANSFWKD
ncbi:leucine-rich repeat-containing G-protein coupled receptor 4-like [Culicoides brevitarsis]|uniref:leucine-rich repeat-containing G-protein coupled receptor 4-like n=1 Tax=Culicoides brevitarsis TaxID=469753 RepID=UPI00307BF25D